MLEIARTKKHSLKQFIGKKKWTSLRRNKARLLEKSVPELQSTTLKSPVAASTSKLGKFGISLQQLETNTYR